MHRWKLPLVLLALVIVSGCSRQAPLSPSAAPDGAVTAADEHELSAIAARTTFGQLAQKLGTGNVVELPAGSVDGLAAAVAQAGDGGAVLVRSGLHTESGTVEITHRVTIVGEPGAVLESVSKPVIDYFQDRLAPALWLHGASGSVVRGLELRPSGGLGSSGILVHGSDNVSVFQNNIHDYQWPVMVDRGDRTKIWDNRVACTAAWQTGAVPEADGIVVVNGSLSLISGNVVTNGLFGIWPCGTGARVTGNKASGCYVGILLCHVPPDGFMLPDGTLTGSEIPTTSCLTQDNETWGCFTSGILAIDGSNNSQVVNNNSHDNGTYDIELAGDSMRFGFLTPHCYNITVVAGSYPNVRVKDCGQGNHVNGGIVVNTDTDACY